MLVSLAYCVLFLFLLYIFYHASPVKGGVDAKELFHLYIVLWIQDKRLSLLESCKLDKVQILLFYQYINCFAFLDCIVYADREII